MSIINQWNVNYLGYFFKQPLKPNRLYSFNFASNIDYTNFVDNTRMNVLSLMTLPTTNVLHIQLLKYHVTMIMYYIYAN